MIDKGDAGNCTIRDQSTFDDSDARTTRCMDLPLGSDCALRACICIERITELYGMKNASEDSIICSQAKVSEQRTGVQQNKARTTNAGRAPKYCTGTRAGCSLFSLRSWMRMLGRGRCSASSDRSDTVAHSGGVWKLSALRQTSDPNLTHSRISGEAQQMRRKGESVHELF
jgi:hypothetical protein